ncbi:helix-hairpin-helix domain-containing protein [Ornithinimicrobium cerasi]|uniref:Competence protein ComEA n=1 Tax=Ornithinimicrobium cerasi TaxID=2248773 RepID=A0A285VEL6_9MICO|nr:helix-hairpin-helix domain-containing protein [Ornithinimicrobium cerasi]SOC52423.1 competence protein ComEA [Ornithinimicrobium cerasi]
MTRDAPDPDDEPDPLAGLLRDLRADARVSHGAPDAAGPAPGADPPIAPDLGDGGRYRPSPVRFVSLPPSLRSVDLGVGLRAVRGMLVVAVVVTLVLGGRWAWALREASPTTGEVVGPVAAGPGAPDAVAVEESGPGTTVPPVDPVAATAGDGQGSVAAGGSAPSAVTPALLLVHVAGRVGDPGVVEVPAGARVIDAVHAAGGFAEDADQAALNLARPVVDGEQVWVGRPGEAAPVHAFPPGMPPGSAGGSGAGGGGGAGGAPGVGAGTLLDLNAATQADLEELPGVGPVTAGQILAWRDAHGRFTRVDELLEVSGIGERTLERLEPLVTVGG